MSEIGKRAYCHTSYLYNNIPVCIKGNWYKIFKSDVMEDHSTIICIIGINNIIGLNNNKPIALHFYKNSKRVGDHFSDFFYIESEYRDVRLDELLNE